MRKNRASRTATKVAAAVLFKAMDPAFGALLPPGLVEVSRDLLLADGSLKAWHLRLARQRWYRRIICFIEGKVAPGHIAYLLLRKRVVQDEVDEALTTGATQVLVLGAGMDTLAMRLALMRRDVTFVELDHPASQAAKHKALDQLGAAPSNLHFLAFDLEAGDLATALGELPGWDRDARTIVVAEGLLEFLSPEAVAEVFQTVASSTGPGSRFLFTYALVDEQGHVKLGKIGRLQIAALRARGEGMQWGVPEGGLGTFLAAQGYRNVGDPVRFDLGARYLEPAGVAGPIGQIELVALAEPLRR